MASVLPSIPPRNNRSGATFLGLLIKINSYPVGHEWVEVFLLAVFVFQNNGLGSAERCIQSLVFIGGRIQAGA